LARRASPAPARSARQRELGQNFLIDRNILDVILRLGGVSGDDVVLEVGGGPGMLSARLAQTARFVHVVEFDERLRERLTLALVGLGNVSLHWGDALGVDLGGLSPAPNKLIANLPYGIAATLVLKTIAELGSIRLWLVMVQREVGERFAAAPGSADYGVPSVLAQLACEVRVARAVSRSVFRPVPNVDSVLLELRRIGPGATRWQAAVVRGAFAHRRKALARSLELAGVTPPGGSGDGSVAGSGAGAGAGVRERAREALVALGHPPDERAQRLAPGEFVALAAALAGEGATG
jgi:16S rRNA (adenine1518-N6/adenine1519-N6)-dimethyltransferase